MFDVRLTENFKLFISGPSGCGKTFFVSKLLENIQSFTKYPPQTILYIYKVWQSKFDELKSVVHAFIEDNENILDQIKKIAHGKAILVIFDDMINSKSFIGISTLFTVHARHLNMSMVFFNAEDVCK